MRIRCDVHQFIETEAAGIPREDKTTYRCVRCPIDDCLRHFKEEIGYFDLDLQRPIRSSNYKQTFCTNNSKHGASMAIVDFRDGKPVWECVLCSPWLRETAEPEGLIAS